MINLFKYRKLAILMLIVLIVSFLLTFIVFWNIVLQNSIKNEGWVLVFCSIVFLTGIAYFLLIFMISDPDRFNTYVEMILNKDRVPAAEVITEEPVSAEAVKTLDINMFAELIKKASSEKDPVNLCNILLKGLTEHAEIVQGILYVKDKKGKKFNPTGSFALSENVPQPFLAGEGFAGQAISDRSPIRINDIPEIYGVSSGLGRSRPRHLLFFPVYHNGSPLALLELGFFKKPDKDTETVLDIFSGEAGKLIHNIFIS